MIEIICNGDDENKSENTKSDKYTMIRRPKNIKQIGDVSSDKKIYIEDYAFSYINSLAYSSSDVEQSGVLLGECQKSNVEKCLFIKGVIKAKNIDGNSEGICFNESVWSGIYSDIEKYFPNLQVIGWFASMPGVTSERMQYLKKIHLDNFAGNMKTMYLIDTCEKDENFYLYEDGSLKKQRGYVCFYERNYEMQEYMLEKRGHRSVEENDKDDVMKSIRGIIQEKAELQHQRKNTVFMYGVSSVLAVMVLVVGINMINSYDKMKSFDSSLNKIVNQMTDISEKDNNAQDVASNDIVPVNKLAGNVYPTQEQESQQESKESAEDKLEINNDTQSVDQQETVVSSIQQVNEATTAALQNQNSTQPENQTEAQNVNQENAYFVYVVKKGDTIMSICRNYYGTITKYDEVAALNNLDDVNKLYVGQEIKLP